MRKVAEEESDRNKIVDDGKEENADQFQEIGTREFSGMLHDSQSTSTAIAKSNLPTVVESLSDKLTRFLSEQEVGSSNDDLIAASTSTNIQRNFPWMIVEARFESFW